MRVTVPSRPSDPAAVAGPRGSSGRLAALAATLALLPALLLGLAAAPAGAVVNGTETPVAGTPFVVQLTDSDDTFCTGSLIRPRIVLTAAHCLVGVRRFRVVLGRQGTQGEGGVTIRAARSAFDRDVLNKRDRASSGLVVSADVGLVQLERDVTEVTPVALGGPEHASLLAPGLMLTVSGWGVVNDRAETVESTESRTLRSATAPVRTSEFCRGRLKTAARGVLCVGKLKRPIAGGCYGDSGGPLYATTPTGAVQMGIVSSGPVPFCGRDTTFYSRVQSGPARTWIDRHISPTGRLRGARTLR